jgi:hypothetical protein
MRNNSKFIIIALLFLSLVSVFKAGAQEEEEKEEQKFEYSGSYHLVGKVPLAFKPIIQLFLGDEVSAKEKPAFYGMISLKNKIKFYLLKLAEIDGLKISFKTKSVQGISYDFSGTFARRDFFGSMQEIDESVLKGTLKKMKGGRVMASSIVSFTYDHGD